MLDLLQQAAFIGFRPVESVGRTVNVSTEQWASTARALLMLHRAAQRYDDDTPLVELPPRHNHIVCFLLFVFLIFFLFLLFVLLFSDSN